MNSLQSSITGVPWSLVVPLIEMLGTMQQGHYTNFVKLAQRVQPQASLANYTQGQWFRCDDETVTVANREDVLNSQAYMLFYSKRRLEYGP